MTQPPSVPAARNAVAPALRACTLDDIAAMHVLRMAVRENALSDPNRVTPDHYRERLRRGRGWVCEDDGRIVAFGISDADERNIWALFVAPGYEGRGIGRALLDAMTEWLFAEGSEPVWLTTGEHTRAARFYRDAGWVEKGRTPGGEIRFERSAREFS